MLPFSIIHLNHIVLKIYPIVINFHIFMDTVKYFLSLIAFTKKNNSWLWYTANLFILFKMWCLSYVWITTSNNDDVHCSLCFWDICMFIGPYFPLHCFTIWKLNKCNPLGPQLESQSLYNIHPVSENSQSGYKVIPHLSFIKLAENSFDLCPWYSRQEVTITD